METDEFVKKLEAITRPRALIYVAVLALVPRLAYLIVAHPPFENYNVALSTALMRDGSLSIEGVKTAYYEPLYPMFLAVARLLMRDRMFLVQALQGAVSGLGAVCLFLLAEALTGRRAVALLSASLYAAYPLLVWHSVTPEESGLSSVLMIAVAYSVVHADSTTRGFIAGLWLGLAILMRSTVLPLLLLAPAILVIDGRRTAAVACFLSAIAIVSPMAIRNYLLAGTPMYTRSGLNLFIGNSRYAAALLPTYTPDNLQEYALSMAEREMPEAPQGPSGEAEVDRTLTGLALKEMRDRPLETLRLKARYVAYFFWPRLVPTHLFVEGTHLEFSKSGQVRVLNSPPRSQVEAMAYTLTYCPVFIAAIAGIWRRRTEIRRDAILWVIVATFVVVHAAYFPSTRYTTPTAFVLLFYGAVGLVPAKRRPRPDDRETSV
jgi:hypothetical protein